MGEPAVKREFGVGGHGHHPSVITHGDPRWGSCPRIVELSTQSFDRDLLGIGSSPYLGDASYLGVRVPQLPTVSQSTRYLFRLVAIQVSNNRALIVRGLRQFLSIGGFGPDSTGPDGQPCSGVLQELAVESPQWRFADGNVSWHLRWENDYQTRLYSVDPNQLPGTSPSLGGTDSVLLYNLPFPPYTPPGAGIPPGVAVEGLGTWHDLRFPWDEPHAELSIPLQGPGTLVFYASVHQSDPDTRCPLFVPAVGIDVLSPEDQFVAAMEAESPIIDVAYQRIAGALTVELFPCCR